METPDFKRGFRGYDSDAVDQAWAESERQLAEAHAANKELRLQINSLREQNSEWANRVKYYEQIEKDLRDALVSAQRAANQIKDEATKQAEELIQSARTQSDTILSEAKQQLESKEIEADTRLIERRLEIVQVEEQLQQLSQQKSEIQTLIDQADEYLSMIKELLK
ncbi:cell division protein DivIVA [Desulfosporosinus sp. HMP52]|uniref:DivIVA domain-containing protein n=1 Tax=Desulfosporosinus sp. HMP52 TaxID=1487923 RepID=UPI00051FE8AE|nr:DivIVA domain-containing protein [Desulfosporosinus sp. HMP52]KGK89832.1 cell division protein DivIVA [Desulfosporosinus sp. HMP52]